MSAIRYVAYYRKSNNDDGGSVEQQRDWAHAAAEREGVELVREFADQAVSGWDTTRRDDFHEMLKFCQEQTRKRAPVQAVVCWHTNRFSRADSIETNHYLHEFREAGVTRILTAQRWYDLARKEDRALLNLEQDFNNHQFSLDLAQATTRGRITSAREGRRPGGVIPMGYRAEREAAPGKGGNRLRTARLILGPDAEVETVRLIFRLYADTGMGIRAVAQELTRRHIPTATNRLAWAPATVKGVLTNPAYLGRVSWNRESRGKFAAVVECRPVERGTDRGKIRGNDRSEWVESPDRHEPIIDLLTWERCQQKLAGCRGGRRRTRGTFVLTGLLRCAHCGHALTGCTGYKGPVYRCSGYNSFGAQVCHYNAVEAAPLADAILAKLRAAWRSEPNIDAIIAEVERQDAEEADEGGREAEVLRKRLRRLDADLAEGVARLRSIDRDLLDDYQQGLKAIRAERDQVERELRRAEDAPTRADDLRMKTAGAMDVLRRLDLATAANEPDLLREVLAEAVAKIEVWFHHEPWGKSKTRCRFARALVWLREDVAMIYHECVRWGRIVQPRYHD